MIARSPATGIALVALILLVGAATSTQARPQFFGKGQTVTVSTGTAKGPFSFAFTKTTGCPKPTANRITAQAAALLNGKFSLADAGKLDWDVKTDACKWKGIECEDGLVSKIDLEEMGLKGNLPIEWTTIATVQELDLSGNEFTGPIPACYGSLSNLEELELDDNKLTGPLPASLGNLQKLEDIELADNAFDGATIPTEWANLKSLEKISLYNTKLAGCVPTSWKAKGVTFIGNSEDQTTANIAEASVLSGTSVTGYC